MSYKSEIRDSQIKSLLDKVQKRNYDKYLYKINLQRVRGFSDQIVTFDFPVTALIAPNGGGKSTILGAAYIAYKESPPRRFFSRSGDLDLSTVKDAFVSIWTQAYPDLCNELTQQFQELLPVEQPS
jgi:predicted ATPase